MLLLKPATLLKVNSSMGVFHVFSIVEMVQNCAKHHVLSKMTHAIYMFTHFLFSMFAVLCRIYSRTQESAKAIEAWVQNGLIIAHSSVSRFF